MVNAEEQVVAGTLHHLIVEVIDNGKTKLYEAKVWVKPWLNFKELQEFKHVGDGSCTSSDLAAKRGNDSKACLYGLPMVPVIRIFRFQSHYLFPKIACLYYCHLCKFDIDWFVDCILSVDTRR